MSVSCEIIQLKAGQAEPYVDALGAVLHACVAGGASVGFVMPFTQADAQAYWRLKVLPALSGGGLSLLAARQGGAIVGTAQLDCAAMPNQQHRADVCKVLVHPEHRRQGIARALMIEVEHLARDAGRTLLTLDTRTGDAAQSLYAGLGYQAAGVIPGYARDAYDASRLDATTYMYKALA
ncbi:GNAT family N-acetyltransferase [Bordetella genomosp. 13]|uniref:GNAT family N-acetyltransferase n=1 Tax=Bordetella genomosp. 13 TaxID=463040 RepID=UPI00119F50E7|nr:GNAT family N-acetyltransferase [Bordetella genomosp. 13]